MTTVTFIVEDVPVVKGKRELSDGWKSVLLGYKGETKVAEGIIYVPWIPLYRCRLPNPRYKDLTQPDPPLPECIPSNNENTN